MKKYLKELVQEYMHDNEISKMYASDSEHETMRSELHEILDEAITEVLMNV